MKRHKIIISLLLISIVCIYNVSIMNEFMYSELPLIIQSKLLLLTLIAIVSLCLYFLFEYDNNKILCGIILTYQMMCIIAYNNKYLYDFLRLTYVDRTSIYTPFSMIVKSIYQWNEIMLASSLITSIHNIAFIVLIRLNWK